MFFGLDWLRQQFVARQMFSFLITFHDEVQTMKRLHYEEYDTTAMVTGHLKQGDDTVYIEFGGILGHVRAITSAMLLLNHRKRDSSITLDGDNIRLERSGHYRRARERAGRVAGTVGGANSY
jgi:hypothetical protein